MTPYYDDGSVTIYHGDWQDVLPSIPDAALIFADPPYHVGIKYASYEDKIESTTSYGRGLIEGLRPRCELLVITPGTVNLFQYPTPDSLIVRFDRTAQSPSGIAWMSKREPVLVYGKNRRRLAWDVIETATHSERAREPIDHPVPKTLSLLHPIIEAFTDEGDLVVDPFLGSGTTLRAAKNLRRRGIGIEIEERYCEIAAKRCAQEVIYLGDAA